MAQGEDSCEKLDSIDRAATGTLDSDYSDLRTACDNGSSASAQTYIFGAVTAVVGAAAVFALYKGYLSGGPPNKERAARGKSEKSPVQVAPVITPTYTGGAVVIEF